MIILFFNCPDFDQSMNIVESPRLIKIFLLLRKELKRSDIPTCRTIRNHILDMFSEHLEKLGQDMKVSHAFWPIHLKLI